MPDKLFEDRRAALEEAFFARHNQELLNRLRAQDQQATEEGALAAASGITDPAVLKQLLGLGIGAASVAALALAPLVLVAWADGAMSKEEQAAILSAAHKRGVQPGGPGHALLEHWLAEAPPPALAQAWKAYIQALAAAMPEAERQALREAVLGQAEQVADAAGGFLGLGLGNRVSAAERAVLHDLAAAFGA
jgi:hypothetical protein